MDIRSLIVLLLLSIVGPSRAFYVANTSPLQLRDRSVSCSSAAATRPSLALNDIADGISGMELDFGGSLGDTLTKIAAETSSFPIPAITDLVGAGNEPLVLGGGIITILGLVAAASASPISSSESSGDATVEEEPEPEPEPIDVSIPYDAAAILAFQEWRQEEPDLNSDLFAKFKKFYEEKSVAEVNLKQKSRNFEKFTSSA